MGEFFRAATRVLRNRFILTTLVVPNILFWSVTFLLPNASEIMVLNLAVLGIATVVIVSYGQLVVTTAVRGDVPDGSDYVAVGIMWSFGALWLRSALSLTWRWLGQPLWILNSDFISGILFASFMAGLMHSVARGALKNGRVPTARWVRIGMVCGFVVVGGVLLLHAADLTELWRRYTTPNDRAPTPSSYIQPL